MYSGNAITEMEIKNKSVEGTAMFSILGWHFFPPQIVPVCILTPNSNVGPDIIFGIIIKRNVPSI